MSLHPNTHSPSSSTELLHRTSPHCPFIFQTPVSPFSPLCSTPCHHLPAMHMSQPWRRHSSVELVLFSIPRLISTPMLYVSPPSTSLSRHPYRSPVNNQPPQPCTAFTSTRRVTPDYLLSHCVLARHPLASRFHPWSLTATSQAYSSPTIIICPCPLNRPSTPDSIECHYCARSLDLRRLGLPKRSSATR